MNFSISPVSLLSVLFNKSFTILVNMHILNNLCWFWVYFYWIFHIYHPNGKLWNLMLVIRTWLFFCYYVTCILFVYFELHNIKYFIQNKIGIIVQNFSQIRILSFDTPIHTYTVYTSLHFQKKEKIWNEKKAKRKLTSKKKRSKKKKKCFRHSHLLASICVK
jgi:hypothetical protein